MIRRETALHYAEQAEAECYAEFANECALEGIADQAGALWRVSPRNPNYVPPTDAELEAEAAYYCGVPCFDGEDY